MRDVSEIKLGELIPGPMSQFAFDLITAKAGAHEGVYLPTEVVAVAPMLVTPFEARLWFLALWTPYGGEGAIMDYRTLSASPKFYGTASHEQWQVAYVERWEDAGDDGHVGPYRLIGHMFEIRHRLSTNPANVILGRK